MSRRTYIYEIELLRCFGEREFGYHVAYDDEIEVEDIWGDIIPHQGIDGFNTNFMVQFATNSISLELETKMAQIHPAHLLPALFVRASRQTRKAYQLELLNGESLKPSDYPNAVSQVTSLAENIDNGSLKGKLRWWRLFALFDRVFFLATVDRFEKIANSERKTLDPDFEFNGVFNVLYEDRVAVGLDGWYHHPTGFGNKARV